MSYPAQQPFSTASQTQNQPRESEEEDLSKKTIADRPALGGNNGDSMLLGSTGTSGDKLAEPGESMYEEDSGNRTESSVHIDEKAAQQGGDEELAKNTQNLSLSDAQAVGQEHPDEEEGSKVHDTKKDEYLDPTPKPPRLSQSPAQGGRHEPSEASKKSGTANHTATPSSHGQPAQEIDFGDKEVKYQEDVDDGGLESRSEIQSIMDQFGNDGSGPGEDEVKSPRTDIPSPAIQKPIQHPPRTSSLEPFASENPSSNTSSAPPSSIASYANDMAQLQQTHSRDSYNRPSSFHQPDSPQSKRPSASDAQVPPSPQSSLSLPKALPPEPDPEPDLPFDFHRFLEQLRHRTADPVAKFLRSFLTEFGKKQWMVHEQVKIISDFLAFITNKMASCEVWRGVSEAEFDNAKEGMEKLVMNRLYTQTFSPALPPPTPVQGAKGKKKDLEKVLGPTRKGQHQEDIERDDILGQKVRIYGWVQEEHLDIKPVGESGRRFLSLAQQGKGHAVNSSTGH